MNPNKYYSKYRAFVIDNLDLQKLGRVKCTVPDVLGTIITDWIFPANNPMYGQVYIPKIGDRIWVEFENGDVNTPVYVGSFYSSPTGESDLPSLAKGVPDISASKSPDSFVTALGGQVIEPAEPFGAVYPNNQVIKTKIGHVFELDDTPGKQRIKIYHSSGSMREYHPDGTMVDRIRNVRYTHVLTNDELHVGGQQDIAIDASKTEIIGISETKVVNLNKKETVNGQKEKIVNGNNTDLFNAAHSETVNGITTENYNGIKTETVVGIESKTNLGIKNETIIGIETVNNFAAKTITVAGLLTINCNGLIIQDPARGTRIQMIGGQILLDDGNGQTVQVNQNTNIVIDGNNILMQ